MHDSPSRNQSAITTHSNAAKAASGVVDGFTQKRQRLGTNAQGRNTLTRQRAKQLHEREYQHKHPRKAA